MTTPDDVVREARRYIGTRFVHQGRLLGVGVDCIGVPVGVCQTLGLSFRDCRNYPRHGDGKKLMAEIREAGFVHLSEDLKDAKPGMLGVFFYDRRNVEAHVGTFTPYLVGGNDDLGVVHTWSDIGKVVESNLGEFWETRLMHIFEYPGVTYGNRCTGHSSISSNPIRR